MHDLRRFDYLPVYRSYNSSPGLRFIIAKGRTEGLRCERINLGRLALIEACEHGPQEIQRKKCKGSLFNDNPDNTYSANCLYLILSLNESLLQGLVL